MSATKQNRPHFRSSQTLHERLEIILAMAEYAPDGCILTRNMRLTHGYPEISYHGVLATVARWLLIDSGIEMERLEARHKCKNRNCINIEHLEAGTKAENEHDKLHHGTLPRSIEEILHIKELYASGLSQYKIAEMYGVTQRSISKIVRGESYNYLQEVS